MFWDILLRIASNWLFLAQNNGTAKENKWVEAINLEKAIGEQFGSTSKNYSDPAFQLERKLRKIEANQYTETERRQSRSGQTQTQRSATYQRSKRRDGITRNGSRNSIIDHYSSKENKRFKKQNVQVQAPYLYRAIKQEITQYSTTVSFQKDVFEARVEVINSDRVSKLSLHTIVPRSCEKVKIIKDTYGFKKEKQTKSLRPETRILTSEAVQRLLPRNIQVHVDDDIVTIKEAQVMHEEAMQHYRNATVETVTTDSTRQERKLTYTVHTSATTESSMSCNLSGKAPLDAGSADHSEKSASTRSSNRSDADLFVCTGIQNSMLCINSREYVNVETDISETTQHSILAKDSATTTKGTETGNISQFYYLSDDDSCPSTSYHISPSQPDSNNSVLNMYDEITESQNKKSQIKIKENPVEVLESSYNTYAHSTIKNERNSKYDDASLRSSKIHWLDIGSNDNDAQKHKSFGTNRFLNSGNKSISTAPDNTETTTPCTRDSMSSVSYKTCPSRCIDELCSDTESPESLSELLDDNCDANSTLPLEEETIANTYNISVSTRTTQSSEIVSQVDVRSGTLQTLENICASYERKNHQTNAFQTSSGESLKEKACSNNSDAKTLNSLDALKVFANLVQLAADAFEIDVKNLSEDILASIKNGRNEGNLQKISKKKRHTKDSIISKKKYKQLNVGKNIAKSVRRLTTKKIKSGKITNKVSDYFKKGGHRKYGSENFISVLNSLVSSNRLRNKNIKYTTSKEIKDNLLNKSETCRKRCAIESNVSKYTAKESPKMKIKVQENQRIEVSQCTSMQTEYACRGNAHTVSPKLSKEGNWNSFDDSKKKLKVGRKYDYLSTEVDQNSEICALQVNQTGRDVSETLLADKEKIRLQTPSDVESENTENAMCNAVPNKENDDTQNSHQTNQNKNSKTYDDVATVSLSESIRQEISQKEFNATDVADTKLKLDIVKMLTNMSSSSNDEHKARRTDRQQHDSTPDDSTPQKTEIQEDFKRQKEFLCTYQYVFCDKNEENIKDNGIGTNINKEITSKLEKKSDTGLSPSTIHEHQVHRNEASNRKTRISPDEYSQILLEKNIRVSDDEFDIDKEIRFNGTVRENTNSQTVKKEWQAIDELSYQTNEAVYTDNMLTSNILGTRQVRCHSQMKKYPKLKNILSSHEVNIHARPASEVEQRCKMSWKVWCTDSSELYSQCSNITPDSTEHARSTARSDDENNLPIYSCHLAQCAKSLVQQDNENRTIKLKKYECPFATFIHNEVTEDCLNRSIPLYPHGIGIVGTSAINTLIVLETDSTNNRMYYDLAPVAVKSSRKENLASGKSQFAVEVSNVSELTVQKGAKTNSINHEKFRDSSTTTIFTSESLISTKKSIENMEKLLNPEQCDTCKDNAKSLVLIQYGTKHKTTGMTTDTTDESEITGRTNMYEASVCTPVENKSSYQSVEKTVHCYTIPSTNTTLNESEEYNTDLTSKTNKKQLSIKTETNEMPKTTDMNTSFEESFFIQLAKILNNAAVVNINDLDDFEIQMNDDVEEEALQETVVPIYGEKQSLNSENHNNMTKTNSFFQTDVFGNLSKTCTRMEIKKTDDHGVTHESKYATKGKNLSLLDRKYHVIGNEIPDVNKDHMHINYETVISNTRSKEAVCHRNKKPRKSRRRFKQYPSYSYKFIPNGEKSV